MEKQRYEIEAARVEEDVLPVARAAAKYEIVDTETLEGAIGFLGKVKQAYDRVETTRKFFTAPLLELKRTYDARFKGALDALEAAEKSLKGKMTEYRLTLPENAPAPKTERTADAKATFVKVWKARVIDEAAVPREYLRVDTAKIDKVVKAGLRNIPGIEVYEEEQVRSSYAG